jgi:hypothetical protein
VSKAHSDGASNSSSENYLLLSNGARYGGFRNT